MNSKEKGPKFPNRLCTQLELWIKSNNKFNGIFDYLLLASMKQKESHKNNKSEICVTGILYMQTICSLFILSN